MKSKKYICVSKQNFTTGITVNEKRVFIDFRPQGSGHNRVSSFIATCPHLIKAMDEDSRHGKIWVDHIQKEPETPVLTPENTSISVGADIVTNFQAARKYLIQNHELSASDIPNQGTVLAAAKLLNIDFAGWKPKSSQA